MYTYDFAEVAVSVPDLFLSVPDPNLVPDLDTLMTTTN
jgi:hypothetical protein